MTKFSEVAEGINSNDNEVVLSAVKDICQLLKIVLVFNTPGKRFKIASHIISLFDLLEKSYCFGSS